VLEYKINRYFSVIITGFTTNVVVNGKPLAVEGASEPVNLNCVVNPLSRVFCQWIENSDRAASHNPWFAQVHRELLARSSLVCRIHSQKDGVSFQDSI
jgi:hypothetical protein